MKESTVVILGITTMFVVFFLYLLTTKPTDFELIKRCESKGGVMASTFRGYLCIKVERIDIGD